MGNFLAVTQEMNHKKSGDWNCSHCDELNFASRTDCRNCNKKQFLQEKPGDWKCLNCLETNFASRHCCWRCNGIKSENSKVMKENQIQSGNITTKLGDWKCHYCNEFNFAKRDQCRKCFRKKHASQMDAIPLAIPPKPGDWLCPQCTDLNFASRTLCRKCSTANPTLNTDKEPEGECVVCMTNKADSIITTCGHLGLCRECGCQLTLCPICRIPFLPEQLIKVFQV